MTGFNWLAAIGLVLVIEGVLPFAAPAMWREGFRRVLELRDGQLRSYAPYGRRFAVTDVQLI